LVEIRRYEPTSPLFGAPLRVTASEFRRDLWHQKTWVHACTGYRDPEFSRFGTVPACGGLWDRQTDGWAYDDSICRASTASRGKNC